MESRSVFKATADVQQGVAFRGDQVVQIWTADCPLMRCRVRVVSTVSDVAALGALREHLRAGHKLDAELTQRQPESTSILVS
jgi:hypothetical protein